MPNLELNGRPLDLADTQRLLARPYAHYTSMQVRGGRVRGLALHMARLDDGNETFFGARMPLADEHRLRELIRRALAGTADASVRVALVTAADEQAPPDVLVSVTDPQPAGAGRSLRVRTDGFQRDWPEQKHAATMGATLARRRALAAGYDDALLVGPDRTVREGTTWNAAFFDGEKVIWPEAPALRGVTMVLLQIAMTMTGVPWALRRVPTADLPDLLAAAAVSALCPGRPIASIDDIAYPESVKLAEILTEAWETVPWDEI